MSRGICKSSIFEKSVRSVGAAPTGIIPDSPRLEILRRVPQRHLYLYRI